MDREEEEGGELEQKKEREMLEQESEGRGRS